MQQRGAGWWATGRRRRPAGQAATSRPSAVQAATQRPATHPPMLRCPPPPASPVAPKQMRMKSKTSEEMGLAPLVSSRTSPGGRGREARARGSASAQRVGRRSAPRWHLEAPKRKPSCASTAAIQAQHSPPTRALTLENTRRSQKGPRRPPLRSPRASAACGGSRGRRQAGGWEGGGFCCASVQPWIPRSLG